MKKLTKKSIKVWSGEDISAKDLKYYQSYYNDNFKNYQAKTLAKKFPKWFLQALFSKRESQAPICLFRCSQLRKVATEADYAKDIIDFDNGKYDEEVKHNASIKKQNKTPKPRKKLTEEEEEKLSAYIKSNAIEDLAQFKNPKPKTFLTLTGGDWVKCIIWAILLTIGSILILL